MNKKYWGKSLAINLFDCEHSLLTNKDSIAMFISKVLLVIDMKAHGQCYVERFGQGSLEGISAMQFIETSSITVHCDEIKNRVFIDIFSCKNFDARNASQFAVEYFHAARVQTKVFYR